MKNIKLELLAPAGNMEKLKTALHFGADAVYLSGKSFGLRAFSDNFLEDEIFESVKISHALGKKVYITVNIFAFNRDFAELGDYLKVLEAAEVDAVLVSDLGVFDFVRNNTNLKIHISTQANTTNKYAVNYYFKQGAERVVLAREVSLNDIAEIHNFVPDCQLEAFVHGAMCISYSGRCLLSNFLSGRNGNRGECVQACRWKWNLSEESRPDEHFEISEDSRGTYILNSKDLNMLAYIDKLAKAGVTSFKIEGRMKSPFYVGTVVNAYRRAIDSFLSDRENYRVSEMLEEELKKVSHRAYTTGFFLSENEERQYYKSSKTVEESKFIAKVIDFKDGELTVEQRNKFVRGDTLEILSKGENHNKCFKAENITDTIGNNVEVCNNVQQILKMPCPFELSPGDILRSPKIND